MAISSAVRSFIPSKRISALLIVVGALITMSLILRHASGEPGNPNTPERPVVLAQKEAVPETDSDEDGLKDWEEVLWSMDPKNPDTDGDDIGDKEEVVGRQAVIEEEKEESLLDLAASLEASAANKNLTKTNILSQSLFQQVITFQDAGITLDSSTAFDVAQIVGQTTKTTFTPPTPVSLSALTIVPETGENLITYTNNLGKILGGNTTEATNEFLVLGKFGQTGDAAVLDNLVTVAVTYEQIIADLKSIPVPQTIANSHLGLINAFLNTKESLLLLGKLSTDPLTALAGLQAHTTYSKSVADAFDTIRTYLRNSVTLTENDPGYVIIAESTQ